MTLDTNGVDAPRMTIEDTLHAILGAQREIVSLLGLEVGDHGSDRVSSIGIEDMAKGPPKITTKFYAGSMLEKSDIDQALDMHGYAHREAERRQMESWRETLEQCVPELLGKPAITETLTEAQQASQFAKTATGTNGLEELPFK